MGFDEFFQGVVEAKCHESSFGGASREAEGRFLSLSFEGVPLVSLEASDRRREFRK